MAIRIAFLALTIFASVFQSSLAQTTHTVGDTSGWTIGSVNYSSWAANRTFADRDILVFNFANNQHDVVQVTKADYDACSTTNPIFTATTSPARITINGTGPHYFICGFPGHCSAGQKLMINVRAATTTNTTAPAPQPSSSSSSPAPQPTTPVSAPSPSPFSSQSAPSPSPVSTQSPAPTPSGSSSGTNYTVGDNQGWTLTSNTAQFYRNWASDKTFNVGDVLIFNYPNRMHDVAEVTKANFDACNTANPISIRTTPPTRITLTAGEHYYICAVPGHCGAGQKLAINVSSSGITAPSPGGSTTPTTPSSPTPEGSTAPPPPDSSARSLSVAGLSATFLSVIVALFY